MSKIQEATEILAALGLPKAQQNERSALTLLALAGVGPTGDWAKAAQLRLRTVDLMGFMARAYRKKYAPNTRETIRRQTLHQFEQARIVDRNPDEPSRPTNSGRNCYQLTTEVLPALRSFEKKWTFKLAVAQFVSRVGTLSETYAGQRELLKVPLILPSGESVRLSPGPHNELQAAIIKEFGPRYAPGGEVLYLGDTATKHVILDTTRLGELHVPITEHDKLPDIILYASAQNWIYLIEAVTSHGPVSPKRHKEMAALLRSSPAHPVYVTAFLSRGDFKKYAADIAWETEVWIAETPEHMIHFNGPKFLGPYPTAPT